MEKSNHIKKCPWLLAFLKKGFRVVCVCVFVRVCVDKVQYRRNPKPHDLKDVQYMPLDENDQNPIQRPTRY
jgi:hypothetical protein